MKSTNDTAELARRITVALDEAHLSSAEVAAACGVSPQAVNGWKKTGRIGKEQLPKLVELTGRPLKYWLGSEEDASGDSLAEAVAVERFSRMLKGRSAADVQRIAEALDTLLNVPRPLGAIGAEKLVAEDEGVLPPPDRRRRRDKAA
ncbi:helix-turn-helix domain-containing protein [Paraburkholderia dioscoreae]|jgi:transcriptional regulator with XRE-family HTH domain|uniref:HTH cro/C1-type domain-containing protein n=1 Tax=Paraburkholderia dioscoreae TaxID=2604047 RepID=A0A5Q4ZB25_9BURK|nr:helix-turn-helix domain-containing protein [Paraburkholderia dioscoreae]VVD29189.1 conserved protein of unknown function [Paraburkholderia dioscoreae]